MADTGRVYAGTVTVDSMNTLNWGTAGIYGTGIKCLAVDDDPTVNPTDAYQENTTFGIWVTDWGFDFASGDTIDGLKVEFLARSDAGSGICYFPNVKLCSNYNSSSMIGTAKSIAGFDSSTYIWQEVGDDEDHWGVSGGLTPEILNSSTFGVAWNMKFAEQGGFGDVMQVDAVSMTVYYTESGGEPASQTNAIFFGANI